LQLALLPARRRLRRRASASHGVRIACNAELIGSPTLTPASAAERWRMQICSLTCTLPSRLTAIVARLMEAKQH
jgi:hypothetical protein